MGLRVKEVRTEPFPEPPKLVAWWRYVWHGVEPPDVIEPGVNVLHPRNGMSRKYARVLHNAAIAHGFESEYVEFGRLIGSPSWQVTIRRPGEVRPPPVSDL